MIGGDEDFEPNAPPPETLLESAHWITWEGVDSDSPEHEAQLAAHRQYMRAVAHHEAGHAILALHFEVDMSVVNDVLGYGVCYYDWGDDSPTREHRRLFSLAGAVAELRQTGRPLVESEILARMSRTDAWGAIDWMPHHVAEVCALLDQYQPEIEAVVEQLLHGAGEYRCSWLEFRLRHAIPVLREFHYSLPYAQRPQTEWSI